MPIVNISHLLSFSSQDNKNPASNLLKPDIHLKWLCNSTNRCNKTEVHLQLETMCTISSIDIGSHNTASVELKVGRSSWPDSKEYETLLPASLFMTIADVRMNKHKDRLRMFNSENFASGIASEKWDRIKVICSQPYSKDKFGISMIKITSCDGVGNNPVDHNNVPINSLEKSPAVLNDEMSMLSPSVPDIKRHFFGKSQSKDSFKRTMKDKLIKLNESGEGGRLSEPSVLRNMKMVMTAIQSPKYKTLDNHPSVGGRAQRKPSFDDEVETFLMELDATKLDLDAVKFSDLRHGLERKKARKLSKEERKVFFSKAQDFMDKFLNGDVPKKQNPKDKLSPVSGNRISTEARKQTPLKHINNIGDSRSVSTPVFTKKSSSTSEVKNGVCSGKQVKQFSPKGCLLETSKVCVPKQPKLQNNMSPVPTGKFHTNTVKEQTTLLKRSNNDGNSRSILARPAISKSCTSTMEAKSQISSETPVMQLTPKRRLSETQVQASSEKKQKLVSRSIQSEIRYKRNGWLARMESQLSYSDRHRRDGAEVITIEDDDDVSTHSESSTPPSIMSSSVSSLTPPSTLPSSNSAESADWTDIKCPICQEMFPNYMITAHADICAELNFTC